jgi:PP-loop superfamily ATP-utilizing enzyme
MEAPQNKSDVTSRFGDRDFVLTVCTCFLCNSDRFEVIRDFRSLKNGGNPFPVDGSIVEKMWRHHSIPGWRFSYSLCRNFPFIFLRLKVIQEFYACAEVKNFSIFGGKYDP